MATQKLGKWVFKIYELLWRLVAARRTIILPPPQLVHDIDRPIFVIGCPRSGTTLMRLMLDSHPSIACPPETFFLLDLAKLWASDDTRKGLAEIGYDSQHFQRKLREFAAYFLQGYAESRGKLRIAEKTPHHVACLDFIEELFGPNAQYIMLYRHPFDVASSMFHHLTIDWHPVVGRYTENGENKYIGYARFWADHAQKMIEFELANPGRCVRVRYEDLVQDAEAVLRSIFEFLGEAWSPDVLAYYDQGHDLGRGDRKALMQKGIRASRGNWEQLNPDLLRQMRMIVEAPARELGYVEFTPSISQNLQQAGMVH
jgi:protein-tyrosine sulfotransferase